MKIFLPLFLTLAALSAAGAVNKAAAEQNPKDYFHCLPTDAAEPIGLVVILPGSSGLKIFKDETHYFDAAARFNAQGYDVVLVEYKKAYRAAGLG